MYCQTSSLHSSIKITYFCRGVYGDWNRGATAKWEGEENLGQCNDYPLDTKYLPSYISVRFTVGNFVLINDEIKVSISY